MDKIYYLDLLTLVESLYQQTATLSTTLPRGVPGLSDVCTAMVRIQHGKVVESVIQSRRGKKIDGSKAFQLLSNVEGWHVRLETNLIEAPVLKPEPQEPAKVMPSLLDPVPRQRLPFDPSLLTDVSSQQRRVLHIVMTMINGRRSVSQIKAQLRLSPETVDWAITYLQHLGVIE